MWFAALSDINHQPWLINGLGRLFSNSESVLALMKNDPFPGKPPNYIRIKKYNYLFSPSSSEKYFI